MHRWLSPLVAALSALLVLVAAALAAACSSDPPPPRWQEVTSGSFSGAETERLDLGTFTLAGQLRLAWELTGPSDARAEFTLEALRMTSANPSEGARASVRSWKENFAPQSDAGLLVYHLEPGDYRVTLTQRLPGGKDVGFAGPFTLSTQDLD
jgi:hypothetical protein